MHATSTTTTRRRARRGRGAAKSTSTRTFALLVHAAAALAPRSPPVNRRTTLKGVAGACAVAAAPSPADAVEKASKSRAAQLAGVLYDCRRGLASPATPDALTSMINTNVLGAGAPLTRGVLCVSERHDCFDHHLAQLYTIKQLRKALRQREDRAQVAVGLEAFQRIHQTYLDRYVSADPNYGLNELFRDVDWQQTWGYDPLHYAPILEDARRTGMRLVGLSPPDELLDAVAKAGGVRNLESPLWPFLPEGGVCNDNAPGRVERLYGSSVDAERLTAVQNFRDEYMADAAARHYDAKKTRDGWLVLLAGQRHVANRDGLPDRVARRVARAASTPAHGDAVFRGVHTILPETTNFPVKLACLPSSTYGDVVWLQPKSADFDPSKVNRAPRPTKSRA